MPHGGDYTIESVENALRTLLLLRNNPSFRAIDVATELQVARSTAHRMVATLEKHNFVRRNPDKSFSAGFQLVELGIAVLGGTDFAAEIQPFLDQLAQRTGETAHFLILDRDESVFVAGAEGTHVVRAVVRVGERLPAHATGAGRVLLAALPEADVASLYADHPLEGGTAHAIRTFDELRDDLVRVRAEGRAINTSHSEEGLMAVARPVVDATGTLRGAISVSGPEWRFAPRLTEVDRLLAESLAAFAKKV
ncbi:MAG TPA: IclR family transcriptional regulator [Propionibacterium sp.]|nr:IclR family transcriptional regulator [Propionibacterium sp.]